MGSLLNPRDIRLLRSMYEESYGAKWEHVHYMSTCKRFDFNYHFFANDVAIMLGLFEGVDFNSAGIMFMSDFANPLRHALKRLDEYALPDEAEVARKERKVMIGMLESPLSTAMGYLNHTSYDPALYRGLTSMGTPDSPVRPAHVSHMALVSSWRVRIGK